MLSCAVLGAPNFALAPGVVISYRASPSALDVLFGNDVYIADADIVVLPNGNYIASHSYFGSGSTEDTAAITRVFRSTNQGATWSFLVQFQPLWRASLFVHGGALYIIGPTHNGGSYNTIRKSTDNGTTWTTPVDASTGMFESVPLSGTLGTPNNPVIFNNRLFAGGGGRSTFSTPLSTTDPLVASDWRQSGSVQTFTTWQVGLAGPLGSAFIGEGQVVASPDTGVVVMGKVEGLPYTALMRGERNLGDMRFGPSNDFAAMPGAEKKFGAAFDSVSGKFYVLSNPILPAHAADASLTPQLKRNTAAVLSSRDLTNWGVEKIFLYSPNIGYEAWQYLQFDFDGDDMVVASRTAFDVGDTNRPPRGHDSNLLTFHRIPNFRTQVRDHYLLADTANNQVLRYEVNQNPNKPAPLGKFTLGATFAGTALTAPKDLAQDVNGDVYIRENGGRILRFDALGNFIELAAASPVAFTTPQLSIAQEASGERSWIKSGSGNWADPLNWYYWGRPDNTTEVATFGSAATAAATVTVDSAPLLWSFNTDLDEEGWATSGITGAAVSAGVFAGTASTAAPILNRLALSFEGSLCPEVRIRLKASGPSAMIDFYWGNTTADAFQAARKITVPYTGAGAFQDIVIPLAGNVNWDGKIVTRIRFDLPKDSGSTFEVDSIEIPRDSFRIKGLRFRNAAAYTISGTGSLRVEPNAGNGIVDVEQGTHVVGVPVTLASTVNCEIAAGTSLHFTAAIGGIGGIVRTGTAAGTLRLSGANTHAGATVNAVGTLALNNVNALQNSSLDTGAAGTQAVTFTVAGTNTYNLGGLKGSDNLAIGGNTIVVGFNGQNATYSGVLSGAGAVTKTGGGALTLAVANTYSGATTVSAGTLRLGAANVIPNGSSRGDVTITGVLDLNGFSETINGLNGSGVIDGSSGAPILTVGDNDATSTFSGVIKNTAGTLSLIKTDTGTLTLSGPSTFAGGTTVTNGTLEVSGSVASRVLVNGGTFKGTGTVSHDLTVNGGVHAPGASPGFMTVTKNYVLNPGGTLQTEINGTTAGTQYDQLKVTGITSTVTLAGALDIIAAPGLVAGSTFTLINNSGNTTAVTGTFAGLPQNTEFYEDAQWWRMSYTGGTGNDVVLTRLTPTPWQNWQAAHFTSDTNNTAIAGDIADRDFDGSVNLLEYALGGDPFISDASILPVRSVVAGKLSLTFTRTLANTDLTLTVQGADSPAGPWTDLATSVNGAAFIPLSGSVSETSSGATRTVQASDQYLLTDPAHPRRFMRLRVVR